MNVILKNETCEDCVGFLRPQVEGGIVKGLFRHTFDYYEWKDFVCASEDQGKLESAYERHEYSDIYPLLTDAAEMREYADREDGFFSIEELRVI